MAEGLTFREFKKDDLSRISRFRKEFFPYDSSIRSCEPEYYEWKCYQNPVLPGEMWLAEDGELLVGIKNITPKRMQVLGTIINGAEMEIALPIRIIKGEVYLRQYPRLPETALLEKGQG